MVAAAVDVVGLCSVALRVSCMKAMPVYRDDEKEPEKTS
jgi:hypothetical protein